MSEKTVSQTHQSSMDQGAIKELLESEAFVDAMRKNLGLKEENVKVCDFCETEVNVKRLKAENYSQLKNDRAAHYCSKCRKVVNDPLVKTKWIERDHTLMDKQGVEMFITNIRGQADKIHFTSNFTTGEIQRIMEPLHRKIALELFQNWSKYGIENKAMAGKIVSITTNLIWAGYNRALEGKTLEGVVNMGDDRTVKKAESGRGKKGALERVGLGGN